MMVGQVLGPFEIIRELGSGAMGAVFLARYTKTGVLVAIKVMNASMGANEQAHGPASSAKPTSSSSSSIPTSSACSPPASTTKSPFYAMEYIEGESLDRVLAQRGNSPWEEVVELGQQLCAALQHAHDKGIVHRDLKPSNLMILPDGTLKLTDFGIAKDLDVTAAHRRPTAPSAPPPTCRRSSAAASAT